MDRARLQSAVSILSCIADNNSGGVYEQAKIQTNHCAVALRKMG